MNVCMFCVQNCGVGVWQKHWRTQIEVTKNMISISRDFDPVKLYPLGSQWLLQTLKKHKRKKVLAEQHCYDLLIIPKTLKHSNLSSKKSTKGKKVFGKQHCYDLLQESTDCLEQKYSSYPFIRQLITNEPHNVLQWHNNTITITFNTIPVLFWTR